MPADPRSVVRRRGVRATATAAAVVAGVWAVGTLLGGPAGGPGGGPGAAPSSAGTVTTTGPRVVVLPVTGVVEPDGTRGPLPDDLVGWLQRHPQVTVLGVRRMRGGGWGSGGVDSWHGLRAVSVDYELSAPTAATAPLQRLTGLPLLCSGADDGCTRLGPGVRVRTTFVTAGSTVTAVESRWAPAADDPVGLPPDALRTAHRDAVLDVVQRLAGAGAEP